MRPVFLLWPPLETQRVSNRTLYGGQAVIEGVMIRGRTQAAVTVRKPSGDIVRHAIPLEGWSTNKARQVPLARGMLVLLETLIMGMKALTISANEAVDDPDDPSGESGSQAITTGGMVAMLIIALAIGIAVFFMIPLFASRGVESLIESAVVANIVEGLIRLVLFLGYIWLIGWMSDIKRVFGYHGAEHMVVAAHEAGAPLEVPSVRRFSTAHPRCGTAFLLTVVLVSILLFMAIPREPFWLLVSSRLFLILPIAAISYELIRFAGTHSEMAVVRWLSSPNLLLQRMTTRQPDDSMIEVAIEAMNYAQELDGAGDAAGDSDSERREG